MLKISFIDLKLIKSAEYFLEKYGYVFPVGHSSDPEFVLNQNLSEDAILLAECEGALQEALEIATHVKKGTFETYYQSIVPEALREEIPRSMYQRKLDNFRDRYFYYQELRIAKN